MPSSAATVLQPASGLRKLYDNFRMFGLLPTVGYVLRFVDQVISRLSVGRYAFDDRFGTDTDTWVFAASELGISEKVMSDGVVHYGPTNPLTLHHLFSHLPIKFENFRLIDVGCGKGRALLVASHYPFASITGIELSESLARIARENIVMYSSRPPRAQVCKRINVIQTDFRDFSIPDGDLVFFLFHPFFGTVFEESMHRIHEAALRSPDREIYLAYVNPFQNKKWLNECGYFIPLKEVLVMHPTMCWSLWKAATVEAGPANFTEAPL